MAAPGTYLAQLTVEWDSKAGKRTSTVRQAFNLLMDPRVAAAGVTQQQIEAQVELALNVADLISDARRLAADVEQKLKSGREGNDDATLTSRADLEKLRDALIRPDGRYTQPMLISQIEYLYGKLDQADQQPGQDMFDRFAVLKKEFEALRR